MKKATKGFVLLLTAGWLWAAAQTVPLYGGPTPLVANAVETAASPVSQRDHMPMNIALPRAQLLASRYCPPIHGGLVGSHQPERLSGEDAGLALLADYYSQALTTGLIPEIWEPTAGEEECLRLLEKSEAYPWTEGEACFVQWVGERPYLVAAAPGQYDVHPLIDGWPAPGISVTRHIAGYYVKESVVDLAALPLGEILAQAEIAADSWQLDWGEESLTITCQPWDEGYTLTATGEKQVAQLYFAPLYEAAVTWHLTCHGEH